MMEILYIIAAFVAGVVFHKIGETLWVKIKEWYAARDTTDTTATTPTRTTTTDSTTRLPDA